MTTMTDALTPQPELADVLPDDEQCARLLAERWKAADVIPACPACCSQVAELLRGNGYDATPELISEWARRGVIPEVPIRAGRFAWMPRHILAAFTNCETWRRWIPNHPRHLHKASAVELAEWQSQSLTGATVFTDLERFDVRACVLMVERAEDADLRHLLAVALLAKLKSLGVENK